MLMISTSWMFPHSPAMAYVAARYGLCSQLPSDINEHMDTLKQYAANCGRIAELGVRGVVSTWAFIAGLIMSSAMEKHLICLDIEPIPEELELRRICKEIDINLQIIRGDSACTQIDAVDLLFIDTWHVEGHLKRELELHSGKVAKFIVLHDTTTDGEAGEAMRAGLDIAALSERTGYSEQEVSRGLRYAIQDFLAKNPEWSVAEQYDNNNGLTILARQGVDLPQKPSPELNG